MIDALLELVELVCQPGECRRLVVAAPRDPIRQLPPSESVSEGVTILSGQIVMAFRGAVASGVATRRPDSDEHDDERDEEGNECRVPPPRRAGLPLDNDADRLSSRRCSNRQECH